YRRPLRFARSSPGDPFMHRSASLVLLAVAPLALVGCSKIERAAGVASGFVSHQLCSATFVSGLEPEQYYREAIAPTLNPVGFLSRHAVDLERREVAGSFAGIASARAVYRGPLGCLVEQGDPLFPAIIPPTKPATARLPEIARPEVVEPAQPA